jgi:hypothetical protein
MRVLFVIIALFLVSAQVDSADNTFNKSDLAMVDTGNQNQNSSENDSTDSEDEEIVFISSNCPPAISIVEPEETIYQHTCHLKSHFYFFLLRPPQYSFLNQLSDTNPLHSLL